MSSKISSKLEKLKRILFHATKGGFDNDKDSILIIAKHMMWNDKTAEELLETLESILDEMPNVSTQEAISIYQFVWEIPCALLSYSPGVKKKNPDISEEVDIYIQGVRAIIRKILYHDRFGAYPYLEK